MTTTDRALLDQPTYIEKLTDLVERAEKNASGVVEPVKPSCSQAVEMRPLDEEHSKLTAGSRCDSETLASNSGYCAICGYIRAEHSGGLMGTTPARCPHPTDYTRYRDSTFKRYGTCEGSIPEFNDPTQENSKPCRSNFGTYRPEHEQVLCDGCAEGL